MSLNDISNIFYIVIAAKLCRAESKHSVWLLSLVKTIPKHVILLLRELRIEMGTYLT